MRRKNIFGAITMKKQTLIIILICLVSTLCIGCQKDKTEKPQKEPSASSSTTEEKETKPLKEKKKPSLPDISEDALEEEESNDSKLKLKKFDLLQSAFRLGGITYQLPFSYARISDRWTFDLKDYGFDDSFQLEPGQRTTDNIQLHNSNNDYSITVGLMNPYDVPVSVKESKIWSITVSIKDATKKPSLRLPAGITWNSSFVDVTLAYSDPTVPFSHDLESKLYYYNYIQDYNHFLNLEISEDEGLVCFTMKRYN